MSKVADFYAKVSADESVRAQVEKVIGSTNVSELSDEQLQKIGEIAKGLGFDISLADAKEYLKSVEGELSDAALNAVAGGGTDNKCKGNNYTGNIQDNSNETNNIQTGNF